MVESLGSVKAAGGARECVLHHAVQQALDRSSLKFWGFFFVGFVFLQESQTKMLGKGQSGGVYSSETTGDILQR